jgi:signal transduction histidine kinase
VKTSIRLRVALAVFLVVVGLVAAQNWYVLTRYEKSFREELDHQLDEELSEVVAALEMDQLESWIAHETSATPGDEKIAIEVLDERAALVARNESVVGCAEAIADLEVAAGGRRYWEYPDPTSRSGARHVRGAAQRHGQNLLCVAVSMEQVQRGYWNLRGNLATSLALIAGLGALVAWVVAARALRPVSDIVARARSLGALPEGSLPRTGSGDEIDRLAEVLNDLLQRIRDEVLHVRRLTADVAHALRTPLTAIRGNLELQAGRADPEHAAVLESSLELVDELARLVNQLLLLEKLESGGRDEGKRERVDLLALTRGLVEHQQVIADERGVALRLHGESAFVRANPVQLRQAIANPIDNAIRHTPRGGTVDVGVDSADGVARARVADSGPGIALADLERVFERFYTTSEDLSRGTGLGLAIARAIARAHGGDLTATSPGGAVFTLVLPLAPDGAP